MAKETLDRINPIDKIRMISANSTSKCNRSLFVTSSAHEPDQVGFFVNLVHLVNPVRAAG